MRRGGGRNSGRESEEKNLSAVCAERSKRKYEEILNLEKGAQN